ncbi:unnamed protein product [Blepharisma stoltei]|uniref:Acyl-coenzyme A oxidase n=1 Tax=Blepharisma stoltei TaxID=1481888 RepID=A0AAU9IEH9_9CILI|nr:unnamed protein product [Blepharisma stoltei]
MMAENRRLSLLSSHLTSRLPPIVHDSSLDDFRKRGKTLDKDFLLKNYLGTAYEAVMIARRHMTNNPLFNLLDETDFTRAELRERVVQQLADIYFKFNLSYERDAVEPLARSDTLCAVGEYDLQLPTRLIIHLLLYIDSIQNLGTQKHVEYARRAFQLVDYGSFSMTELGHGSNVASLETTATYDKNTREFVFNSPTFTSAKWMVGAIGKTANMTVCFAQLIVDDVKRGVHVFLIPIRDYNTHEPLPGLVLGDCGKKNGLEGVDNGFAYFKNYRAPYDCLLDKYASITPDGKYKSAIKNKEKRLAVMLAGLIKGRASVVCSCEEYMRNNLTIALRYAAIRKQFGLSEGSEVALLDYQLHRYRLLPHLAKMFAVRTGYLFLCENYVRIKSKVEEDPECLELAEHHAILSALKALASWYGMACTQECRESAGGSGYSYYSGLARNRNSQDVHITWEGDSSVLIQQAGRFILKSMQKMMKGQRVNVESLKFLKGDVGAVEYKVKFETAQELENEGVLDELLEFYINAILHRTMMKLQENATDAKDMVDAWNKTQAFGIQDLGKAFGEYIMTRELLKFVKVIENHSSVTGAQIRNIFYLYVIGVVEKNLTVFVEGGMSPAQAKTVRDAILQLCNQVAEESINIIDALAPIDNVLGSTLGHSDGQAYTRTLQKAEATPFVYDKAPWFPLVQKAREIGKKRL